MPDEPRAQDGAFAMPAVDEAAQTEIGVILAGLDAPRLLAGLGMASLADDATLVTLLVDQVRHSGGGELTMRELHELGARRWCEVRAALSAAGASAPLSGSVRQSWERAVRVVIGAASGPVGVVGPGSQAYLAACLLRRTAIDELVSQITGGGPTTAVATDQEAGNAVSEVATR
ncbi:MAG TPA: DUF6187 family protein [Pseudonocardiaceae bacterium]|jgi:hypothetical protein|nr:DUF6187 family protein [Pseudonocardiaceae bacterium]